MAALAAKMRRRFGSCSIEVIRYKGAIFCQVSRAVRGAHLSLFLTVGNHRCIGGIPAFTQRPRRMHTCLRCGISDTKDVASCPVRKRIDPVAWAMKYIVAAVARALLSECTMRGMKAIVLSSNPSQAIAQLGARTTIEVPEMSAQRERSFSAMFFLMQILRCR